MNKRSTLIVALITSVLAYTIAWGADPTIGSCTRKDEFAKKQLVVDELVLQLAQEKKPAKQKALIKDIVTKHGSTGDIENLIRYREPHLIPIFVELLEHKNWAIRGRALYALKMIGNESCIDDIVKMLDDSEPQVRELAANALSEIGNSKAKEALSAKLKKEKDIYVIASIEAAIGVLSKGTKPYSPYYTGSKYEEKLVGQQGARRVEWAWTVKGPAMFNDNFGKPYNHKPATEYRYPISWYKNSLFTTYPRNSFGGSSGHAAEDCAWFREGCSYYALADGVVRMVQGAGGDWGFLIVLEHLMENGDYIVSLYGHAAWDVLVRAGEEVRCGQKIATEGLSCSVENGGYGSHLHFGIGDGPFRRPKNLMKGDEYSFEKDGKKEKGKILRFVYADEKEGKNEYGWPKLAAIIMMADGTTTKVVLPAEHFNNELSWMQAYIKDCKGWLNPQTFLPEYVEGKKAK